MHQEETIIVVPKPRHHDGPPSSLACRQFYDQRHKPFEEVIAKLIVDDDIEGIDHLGVCLDCRLAIQMREVESSESYMDIQLKEAREQCAQNSVATAR